MNGKTEGHPIREGAAGKTAKEKCSHTAAHEWPLSTYLDHTLIGLNLLLPPVSTHRTTARPRLDFCEPVPPPVVNQRSPGYWATGHLARKTSTVVPREDVFMAFLRPCSLGQDQEGRRNLARLRIGTPSPGQPQTSGDPGQSGSSSRAQASS